MDTKVTRIVGGVVHGVRPSLKKSSRDGGRRSAPFSLEQAEAPATPPDDPAPEHEPLHVSRPDDDEVGGTLDLTA